MWVASSEREKDFPSNRLLLLQRGKLAAVIGFLLRYTAITLPTVYKLLQALQSQKGRAHRRMYVPSLFVSNVMSLPPKGDELRHAVMYATLDLVCITESWLKRHIHDKVVAPDSYNIIRRDRSETEHGGVCMCINNTVKFTVVDDLDDSSFEVLWIQISPICLLRGYSSILPGVFYHSPSGNDCFFRVFKRCLSSIETRWGQFKAKSKFSDARRKNGRLSPHQPSRPLRIPNPTPSAWPSGPHVYRCSTENEDKVQ